MTEKSEEDRLREAQYTSYAQRSRFLLRKLKETDFQELVKQVNLVDTDDYDWSDLKRLGISRAAWDRIRKKGNSACKVFCHPDVIMATPRLIAYYRGIAGLSAKGMQQLAYPTERLEAGKRALSSDNAWDIASTLNSITSHVIENEPDYSTADAILLLHTTVGIAINGSWRNLIGGQAEAQVREMIASHFYDKNMVAEVVTRKGARVSPSEAPPGGRLASLVLRNGYRVEFGSEPDVKAVGPRGDVTGVIEIKGGLDPAGAVQRYGAAMKTFDNALSHDKTTRTIYLVACLTPKVRDLIEQDRLVHNTFNLTSVLLDDEERQKFLREIEWWVAK